MQLLAHTESAFVREVLRMLQTTGRNLPDAVQPEKFGFRPHLFYEARAGSPTTCVLCAEVGESLAEMRFSLEEVGFKVIIVQRGQPLEPQIAGRKPFED